MATKINLLLSKIPAGGLVFSAYMTANGISTKEQTNYVRSEWIDRMAQGVYYRRGNKPTLYSSIFSYNEQLGKHCYVGATTALDIAGFSHFVAMGKPTAYLFTTKAERLPKWFLLHDWDMAVAYSTTKVFGDSTLGVMPTMVARNELWVSSPERAIMECLNLSPTYFSLMDIYYIMEMLTTLRPKLVQQLLESCTSVKIKRLFLLMAEKAGHAWFGALDLSNVDLGEGKRALAPNGQYNAKYRITVPTELNDYE